MAELTCLTWNIHRGRGNDGVIDPRRTMDVLQCEVWQGGTDVLVLVEADAEAAPHRGVLDVAEVERITGLRHLHGDASTRSTDDSHGLLGVVVYAAPRITVEAIAGLELGGVCPRRAVVVDMVKDDVPVRLVATHLSLSQYHRAKQLRVVGRHLQSRDARQTVLCGDLNEWRPWGGVALSRAILGRKYRGPAKASFPVGRPFLPLDRVLSSPEGKVLELDVLDGAGIRATSDHRPVYARVSLNAATSA